MGTRILWNDNKLAVVMGRTMDSSESTKPGVHAGLWGQYFLDNAATVAEAVELMKVFSRSWSRRAE